MLPPGWTLTHAVGRAMHWEVVVMMHDGIARRGRNNLRRTLTAACKGPSSLEPFQARKQAKWRRMPLFTPFSHATGDVPKSHLTFFAIRFYIIKVFQLDLPST